MKEHEEISLELENRIKNLMWTVSGDYELDTKPDVESFRKSKYISLYDAIKQGAFSKYFDKDAFGLYLVKKIYLGGEEGPLMSIAQLCVDSGVHKKIEKERLGVADIRREAFDKLLEYDFHKMTGTFLGRVKLALLREVVTGRLTGEKRICQTAERIKALEDAEDTMDLIQAADEVYNTAVDPKFEKRVGDLNRVLAVSMQDLKAFQWEDFLEEEAQADQLERYMRQMADTLTNLNDQEKEEKSKGKGGVLLLDEEAVAKMYSYIELNYGRSYLTELEQKRWNQRVCQGIHADCSLYFTDGILSGMVKVNSQSEYARRTKETNLRVLHQNRRVTKRNIEILSDILKRALTARNERDVQISEYGQIIPQKLWNIGRTRNRKLFLREHKQSNTDFVVEVLIDASGSQRARQSQVALQAYIISEALSNVRVPHKVMSFCTFWDYTVMRRFRDYDEGREANERIFEFYASSNNRDGLAIRAVAEELAQRPEENKILIVLSDGRPNDIIVNRPNSKNPTPYFGDYAVKDTAFQVRKMRNAGMAVLGVFAGEEQDLDAERRIFGKDFAYIKNISNFSNVVGMYLQKQLGDEKA